MTYTGRLLCSLGDLLWKFYWVNAGPGDGVALAPTGPGSSPLGRVGNAKEGRASTGQGEGGVWRASYPVATHGAWAGGGVIPEFGPATPPNLRPARPAP